MNYEQWDIVLIKFPFTDLTKYKLRPALIISNSNFNKFENLMLIWIYWNKWNKAYSLPIKQENLKNWKLNKQSYFRFQNIISLEKNLVEKKVANLNLDCLKTVNKKIEKFLEVI